MPAGASVASVSVCVCRPDRRPRRHTADSGGSNGRARLTSSSISLSAQQGKNSPAFEFRIVSHARRSHRSPVCNQLLRSARTRTFQGECGQYVHLTLAATALFHIASPPSPAFNSDDTNRCIIPTSQLSPRICTSQRISRARHREKAKITAKLSLGYKCLRPLVVSARPTSVAIVPGRGRPGEEYHRFVSTWAARRPPAPYTSPCTPPTAPCRVTRKVFSDKSRRITKGRPWSLMDKLSRKLGNPDRSEPFTASAKYSDRDQPCGKARLIGHI